MSSSINQILTSAFALRILIDGRVRGILGIIKRPHRPIIHIIGIGHYGELALLCEVISLFVRKQVQAA